MAFLRRARNKNITPEIRPESANVAIPAKQEKVFDSRHKSTDAKEMLEIIRSLKKGMKVGGKKPRAKNFRPYYMPEKDGVALELKFDSTEYKDDNYQYKSTPKEKSFPLKPVKFKQGHKTAYSKDAMWSDPRQQTKKEKQALKKFVSDALAKKKDVE